MTTNTPSDELQLLIQLHQRLDQLEAHTAPASGMSWLMAAVIAAGLHYAALPALQASGIPFVTTKTNTVLAWEQQQADRLVSWLTGSTRPALHPRTGTHPDLKTLYDRAQALARADGFRISIREADRTPEKQAEYVKKGASKTLNSRHLPDANGISHALDLEVKYPGPQSNKTDWYWVRRINGVMQQASQDTGIPYEWGGDWQTFKDGYHFQLPWAKYPKASTATVTRTPKPTASTTSTAPLPTLTTKNQQALLDEIKRTESSGGHYGIENPDNCMQGAYQMSAATLVEVGLIQRHKLASASLAAQQGKGREHCRFLNTASHWTLPGGKQAFLSNPALQDKAARIMLNKHLQWGVNAGAIRYDSPQHILTGYLKATQFGWMRAVRWYRDGQDDRDGNRVRVSTYARQGEAIATPAPSTFNALKGAFAWK
ncbi:MAG: M15 family metallopeptidase [Thiothrix sp.]|nr:M15 family metallopeptidase [Thiothrix sp.]